jgi:hypothetical protein
MRNSGVGMTGRRSVRARIAALGNVELDARTRASPGSSFHVVWRLPRNCPPRGAAASRHALLHASQIIPIQAITGWLGTIDKGKKGRHFPFFETAQAGTRPHLGLT